MSIFLCRSRFYCSIRNLRTTINLGILRNPNVCSLRWFSSGNSDQEQSFTVSYLIDSLGLSPKQALSASKLMSFKTCEKPDKVIRFLESYGFTKTQISALVRARPALLVSNSEKTILPKLEFLKAKGVSWLEMPKSLSVFPAILHSSLEKQVIPAFEFFRSVFHSDEKLVLVVQRYPDLLAQNVQTYFLPNITVLREHGVSDSNIAALIRRKPRVLMVSPDNFVKVVDQVVGMGFDASTVTFIMALAAFRSMSKSAWESKVCAYKKWGWSDEEVSKAFEKYPQCLMISPTKIESMMDFFVNEMGLRPCHVVTFPAALNLSLEKRLIPRCRVFRALFSKGLVKKKVSLGLMFGPAEKNFLQKFVTHFIEKAPELMKLYKDNKLGISSGSETDEV